MIRCKTSASKKQSPGFAK